MTLTARRLLIAGGDAVVSPPLAPFAIGPAGAFGWSDFSSHVSTAIYYAATERTYYAWLKSNGTLALRSWSHTGSTYSSEVNLGSLEVDLHDVPSLVIRDSDKRLLIFYALHGGGDIYYRASTNTLDADPTMSGGFGAQQFLDSQIGGSNYTYPMAMQLTGEANDPIYLFFRSTNGGSGQVGVEWGYSKSTDGGSTWTAQTVVWGAFPTRGAYMLAFPTSTTRIDILAVDGSHGYQNDISVYHGYYDGTWRDSAGSAITAPFSTSELTLVHDGTGNKGAAPTDVVMGVDGKPVVAYRIWETYGASLATQDMRYWWKRWTGSAWSGSEVAANGVGFTWGNIALSRDDPRECVVGQAATGELEMYRYYTANNGASFTSTQLTSNSPAENVSVVAVLNPAFSLRFVWGRPEWGDGTSVPYGWG